MATIEFKGKAEKVSNFEGEDYYMINVPALKSGHCDMASFRRHPKYSGIANSDLFPNALKRIAHDIAPAGFIRTDRLPANVVVDMSGFLAKVTVTV